MSIIELGALGEFVAAVAVLVTLIYLALQIRQTRKAVSASAHQAVSDISIHLYTTASSNVSLAAALAKSNLPDATLSNTERYQCTAFWTAMIRNTENMYHQYEIGLLTEERIRVSTEQLRRLMARNAHFQRLWKSLAPTLRRNCRIWIESTFAEHDSKEEAE